MLARSAVGLLAKVAALPPSPAPQHMEDVSDITKILAKGTTIEELKVRPSYGLLLNATVVVTNSPIIDSAAERADFQGQLVLCV